MSQKQKEWITAAEFAEKYQVHVLTVYRWVKEGRLPHKRLGRVIRIHDSTEALNAS